MSTLIVEVCRINKVVDHPYADRLKICTVKGWQSCIPYNPETGQAQFIEGDLCVYFPPDSIIPPALIERLGVEKYVQMVDGGGRVKACRLRGVPSYGLVMTIDPSKGDLNWNEGDNVADFFGVTKWEPKEVIGQGEAAREHVLFHRYTNIENIGNYPRLFKPGEEVICTEKIHGQNFRVGAVFDNTGQWIDMCGSNNVPRKQYNQKGELSRFWYPYESAKPLVDSLKGENVFSVILFGEIYGSSIQDMNYGMVNGQFTYRFFDIAVNGLYLDFDRKTQLFEEFNLEAVPVLYRGPFSFEVINQYTSGETTVCKTDNLKFKGREGIVIHSAKETDPRRILKSISSDYLARKGGTDNK